MAAQIHIAGSTWIRVSRQLVNSSFTPSRSMATAPTARASGASHGRERLSRRTASSTAARSLSLMATMSRPSCARRPAGASLVPATADAPIRSSGGPARSLNTARRRGAAAVRPNPRNPSIRHIEAALYARAARRAAARPPPATQTARKAAPAAGHRRRRHVHGRGRHRCSRRGGRSGERSSGGRRSRRAAVSGKPFRGQPSWQGDLSGPRQRPAYRTVRCGRRVPDSARPGGRVPHLVWVIRRRLSLRARCAVPSVSCSRGRIRRETIRCG